MSDFNLWAEPIWVNLLVLVPVFSWLWWRWRARMDISSRKLGWLAAWALGFAVVEAGVVVYLRAVLSLLEGGGADVPALREFSEGLFVDSSVIAQLPVSLYGIEIMREFSTLIMLFAAAAVSSRSWINRWGAFLWTFAAWDLGYYLFLRIWLGWPSNLLTGDVLFLVPTPWFAQIWFPVLVSSLTLFAVWFGRRNN